MFKVAAQPTQRLLDAHPKLFNVDSKTGKAAISVQVEDTASRLLLSGAMNDADGAYFLAQQLESIQAQVLPVKYADITFRSMFPVDTSVPAGAETYGFYTQDMAGQAEIINAAAKDIPWSTVKRGKVTQKTAWFATKFGYSYGEIEAAKYSGMPLEQSMAAAARRAMEEKFDTLAWDGDDAAGITGIFNNTDIVTASVPAGVSTTTPWTTKTPDEIVADINKAFTDPWVLSKQKELPDTLAVPTAQWALLNNTRLTDTGRTIMSYVLQESTWLNSPDQLVSVPLLDGKGTAGVDVMCCYKKDPSNIKAKVLQDVMFMPVQQNGLEFEVIVLGKSGGVELPYPVSFYILEGI